MNPRKFNIAVVVALLLYFTVVICCCSCSFIRKMDKTTTDTTAVSRKDSGSVSRAQTKENTEATWWREILMNQATKDGPSETQYITQPTVYIREGGTMQQQKETLVYDSSWKQAFDSLKATMATKQTETKGKAGLDWYIWLIFAALAWLIFKDYLPNFKIVKNDTASSKST